MSDATIRSLAHEFANAPSSVAYSWRRGIDGVERGKRGAKVSA
jgi:hypothetical protein